MRLLYPLATALLCAAVGPAQAQASSSSDGTIVVEGRRITRDEARIKAAELLRHTTAPSEFGQYARWNARICPSVLGIAPVYAAMVLERVRVAAEDSGARVDKAGCRPNLVIGFASDARSLSDFLRRHASFRLFQAASTPEKEEFVRSDRPVRWLYSIGSGSDGGAASTPNSDQLGVIGSPVGAGGLPGFGDAVQTSQYGGGSLIRSNLVVGLTGALIIVDMKSAEGVPLDSISNYVARVALAQTRLPPLEVTSDTVLQLFDRPADPTAVTQLSAWDRAYLKALYRIPANRSAFAQRGPIQHELIKALSGGS